ncbi:MAG: TetR/AcrR family transcriptional regulator [Coriobacteriia bacterium]|nr:TetR/AcrR family transcriptional regulator [Coriobacteriia bacterium]
MANRQEELMEATFHLVAEEGLYGLTLKKVAAAVGVSETLVYKYFRNKEELLYSCFEMVHKDIGRLCAQIPAPEGSSIEYCLNYAHTLWLRYFDLLISEGERTLFYFIYRDSPYIKTIQEGDAVARTSYFKKFADTFISMRETLDLEHKMDADFFWAYVLDTTGIFARRFIRGELPDTPESRETVWKMIYAGLSWLA